MTKIKTLALGAASALGVIAIGASAQAATMFTANIVTEQSATPEIGEDVSASATLTLTETTPGAYTLSMEVSFSDGFDWTGVIGDGAGQVGTDAVTGDVASDGFDLTRFHIHNAPRGVGGPVVFGLFDVVAPPAVSDEDGDTSVAFADDGSAVLTSEWDMTEGTADGVLADFVAELLAATTGQDVALYFNLHSTEAAPGLIRGQLVGANDIGADAVPVPAAAFLFAPVVLGGLAARRRKARA